MKPGWSSQLRVVFSPCRLWLVHSITHWAHASCTCLTTVCAADCMMCWHLAAFDTRAVLCCAVLHRSSPASSRGQSPSYTRPWAHSKYRGSCCSLLSMSVLGFGWLRLHVGIHLTDVLQL